MTTTTANSTLFREQAFINGRWTAAASGKTFPVHDPANNAEIGQVPDMADADVNAAIEAAHQAFPAWRDTLAADRAAIMKKWFALINANTKELAVLMTRECGKPLAESIGEIKYGASFIEWSAEQVRRLNGEIIPTDQKGRRLLVIRQPVGVVAAVTPWNFPNSMITRKVSPAIASGCTVVLKPAELTPFSALALAALAEEAGLPPGVLNIVTTTNAKAAGLIMSTHPLVRKVTFTGSTPVGKWLMEHASSTLKKISLELGGNAPFIVFEDADIDAAVEGAIASKFRNSGQTCVCANRIYVQQGAAAEFTEKFTRTVSALKVAPGLEDGAKVGPVINDKGVEKVMRLLKDATDKGAKVETGGKAHALGGRFIEPTVLSGVTSDMACMKEEIFGPVAPVQVFQTEAEAIQLANDTEYGLASYVYTRDQARTWRISEALEYGMVGINTGLISTAVAPFGGIKESGTGREGSTHALDEFTELKYVNLSGL
ncbi:MAG TPA: NAD-dependent succinate-semialdehyde dehydrogenase [Flavobacteriales bacterium]